MTMYVGRGYIKWPDGDWFDRMLATHQELIKLPKDDRHETDCGMPLHNTLTNMEGVTLHKSPDHDALGDSKLSFAHFDPSTRQLVMIVEVQEKKPDGTHATDFDTLFEGQYDPEELQLGIDDFPFVIVQVDEHGRPHDEVTVIQPHNEALPDFVCAAYPPSGRLLKQLLKLAA